MSASSAFTWSWRERLSAAAGAALVGGLYGGVEAILTLIQGRVVVASPALLLSLAVVAGGLTLAPLGAGLARSGLRSGALMGLAGLAVGEGLLWVFQDVPQFTRPLWWQGNLALAGLAAVGCLGLGRWLGGRAPWLALLLAPGLLLPLTRAAGGSRELPPAQGPNLLIVTLDTTRADRLRPWGGKVPAPTLTALASRGVLFERAYSPIPTTGPSHISLFTGQGPWTHGVLLNGRPVPAELTPLAESLRSRGYRTGAFVSAAVLHHGLGFERGFQVYDDDFSWSPGAGGLWTGRLTSLLLRRLSPHGALERPADRTTAAASRWVRRQEHPWFAWVHLFDAHGPYAPPAPFDTAFYEGDPRSPRHRSMKAVGELPVYLQPSVEGITDRRWVEAQYDGEIAFADSALESLLELAEQQDALVVVVGDHGESLGEEGVWFSHGELLDDGALRVPLVMSWPGRLPEGLRVREVVELVDLLPTLSQLMGLPARAAVDGQSLLSADGELAPPAEGVARATALDRLANLESPPAQDGAAPTLRMSSVRAASGRGRWTEARDQARVPGPESLVQQARELLSAPAPPQAELSPRERARLEALGYMEPPGKQESR